MADERGRQKIWCSKALCSGILQTLLWLIFVCVCVWAQESRAKKASGRKAKAKAKAASASSTVRPKYSWEVNAQSAGGCGSVRKRVCIGL